MPFFFVCPIWSLHIHQSSFKKCHPPNLSMDRAGWLVKLSSIEIWIPWRNALGHQLNGAFASDAIPWSMLQKEPKCSKFPLPLLLRPGVIDLCVDSPCEGLQNDVRLQQPSLPLSWWSERPFFSHLPLFFFIFLQNLVQNKRTLLPKFFGLYCYQVGLAQFQ